MATQAGPSWQEQCTNALVAAVGAGRNGQAEWEKFRAQVPDAMGRIIIADGNFDRQALTGFDLSRCYIVRTSFREANLSNANFAQSIFRNCDASGANVEGANFRDADMKGDGLILIQGRFDGGTDFEVSPSHLPDQLPKGLLDAAFRARHERLWRYRKSYSRVVRLMLWLTQHGFSLGRLSLLGGGVIVLFSLVFCMAGEPIVPALMASGAYFINLDQAYNSGWLQFVGLVEALIGLLFFALVTAILVSIFFEKN